VIPVTKPSIPELEKYIGYLQRIWETKWLTNNGEFMRLLEKNLQDYLKVQNIVLVSNGTLALQLALKSLHLHGEVITTPFTFVATTNSILWEGLTPVFADIDPETFNIDPEDVEKKITKNTCAILAVHVYGNPCNVEELAVIADRYRIKLIYDGAHSFDVEYGGRSVFDYGDVSTLSFHATKVFNTIEGGALLTGDATLAGELRLLRDHGIRSAEDFVGIGTNAKMNELQAAMGLCNLDCIKRNIKLREELYKRYVDRLAAIGQLEFQKLVASKYNYAYMPVCFESMSQRDLVHNELFRQGVGTRKYFYPLTVNARHFASKPSGFAKAFGLEVASDVAQRVLCLPIFPGLSLGDVDKIIEIIGKSVARVLFALDS
jgi:dTDP-4-amino-4,6-dideoxygalactose transaminase